MDGGVSDVQFVRLTDWVGARLVRPLFLPDRRAGTWVSLKVFTGTRECKLARFFRIAKLTE